MDFWSEVAALNGRELRTLRDKRVFQVLAVTGTSVILHLRSTDKERIVKRVEIEPAYQELRKRGTLSRTAIRDLYSERNPAYVAAILAVLPNCRYTLDPIRVWCSSK